MNFCKVAQAIYFSKEKTGKNKEHSKWVHLHVQMLQDG